MPWRTTCSRKIPSCLPRFHQHLHRSEQSSKGEWKEGYDYLEKAITAEDSHDFALPSLYANAALCLHKMGKKRKAHQYCKKAYDLAPEEIDPYLIEGRIYMEEGEYEKGVKNGPKP